MDATRLEERLGNVLRSYDERADTDAVSFALSSPSHDWRWSWSADGADGQYFVASITKLFTTTMIMQLRAEEALDIDEAAAAYLGTDVMAGIHMLDGVDASQRITVRELLSHTSGIADYFEQKRADGTTTIDRLLDEDFAWSFADVLHIVKEEMTPRFAPSTPGKAYYSDTGFQLLGAIVEAVTGATYEEALEARVLRPLELDATYVFTTATLDRYETLPAILSGTEPISVPLAMSSMRPDGGIVSTAPETLTFLEAFMGGKLFPAAYLDEMQAEWNGVFFPLEYGLGIMRYALPRYLSPFRPLPPMVGHSGASGTVLYYVPDADLYISGAVNQLKKRSLVYQLMTKLVVECRKAFG
jgi:CubicO group peptidase (beta-lactamase class C family)